METTLFVSLFFVFYAYAGYPAVALALASLWPRSIRQKAFKSRVSVILIAHNEEARIAEKLENCLALDYPADLVEIIVASDGSTDGTRDIIAEFEDRGVRFMDFEKQRGKAACLNDAIAIAESDFVVLVDVRQTISKDSVSKLLRNFADESVGAVSGELVFRNDSQGGFGAGVGAYWRYEKLVRKAESQFDSVIGATGALYALRRSLFRPIPPGTILDDVLIPMNVIRSDKRVVFESEAIVTDTPSGTAREERARKIRTSAGNYQLLYNQPWLLSPFENRLAFQYFSHKVTRILAPFFLASALLANISIAGESRIYAFSLAAQIFGYLIALVGVVWPGSQRWRVVTVAKTFLLLNWFAALGLLQVATNRRAFIWRWGKIVCSTRFE